MAKPLGTTCKVIGATVIIGMFALAACLFSESNRTVRPARRAR